MTLLLAAFALLGLSGFAALCAFRSSRLATLFGAGGAITGCGLALVPVIRVLLGAQAESLRVPWQVPYGSFYVELDALSAFFLLAVLILGAATALYGAEYLQSWRNTKSLGPPWFFFNLVLAAIGILTVARNAVLFLMAWEVMTLSAFFLVTFEDEKPSARQAGWTYLIATHLGTTFLLPMFILLGQKGGSLDFDTFAPGSTSPGLLFVFALIGFGTKAGFMPLHVWLPEAHPAAPSHVSALLSGVIIKTGIYGLVRTLTFLGPPAPWWGWTLIGIGLTSGILGVLFALAQHDLKRLLAYHSIENIGIIALGLGVGLLGLSSNSPTLAALGFAGGLLHVLNHALFKGLLFLGAGAVAHATGTREMDQLGGLLKKMPFTAIAFLIGSAAICGLPPLNGFVSEFLIFLASFSVGQIGNLPHGPLMLVIGGLGLIGGLAAACFNKAFGIVFLGTARASLPAQPHEPGLAMRLPMLLLAAACVVIGVCSPLLLPTLAPVVACAAGVSPASAAESLATAFNPLFTFVVASLSFLALLAAILLLRRLLLRGRGMQETVTWDCGYAQPTARMQYTSSSFAQPLTSLFKMFLRTRVERSAGSPSPGLFPRPWPLHTDTPDVAHEGFFAPVFRGIEWGLSKFRWLQHGRVQLYVLYIALMLLLLLFWKL